MIDVRLLGRAANVALLLASSAAIADTRVTANVGVDSGIATNPYGSTASNTGSGTVSGTLNTIALITMPTGAINLRGSVTHTEYFKLYNGTTDFTVATTAQQQLSPLVSMSAGASYSSQVRNGLYPVIDPTSPPTDDPNAPIIVDPDAATSFAERVQSFSGNLGMSVSLSPRDSFSVSARGSKVLYPMRAGAITSRDFASYGAGLSYRRQIGTGTSIGAAFDVNKSEYERGGFSGGTQISPSLTLNTALGGRFSLNAAAGVTFSETDFAGGANKTTSFSGSVGICYTGDRARFCGTASQRVAPSSFSGTSTVSSISGTYSYRLSEGSNIGVSASYSKAKSLSGVGNLKNDYAQISTNYSRRLTQRLSAVASLSYSETHNSTVQRDGNFFASIGLRYSLGEIG